MVELQEELLKLRQEKSGISGAGQSNLKPMRDRVGKRDVRERVGVDQVAEVNISPKKQYFFTDPKNGLEWDFRSP